jgi:hypothetical protein
MEWITERQPTEADADNDGEVIMLRRADGRGNGATRARDAFVDWRHVGPGVPWKHNRLPSIQGLLDTPVATESKPQPAPEPVASDRPALAVGQTWMDRDGRVVTIEGYDPVTNNAWPFWGSDGHTYRPNGRFGDDTVYHSRDLVELISEAPEPAPVSTAPEPPATVATASEFPEAIRSGATPFYVMVVSDEHPQRFGGQPIVWEHVIPRTTTLQFVLRQQRLHGHRYGTTYIAECRIIPLLTREAPAQQPQP